eukprot:TRINITY_DN1374_c0_g3_i1.p1 TRINITY_DN1374_c0_g3~~TRINITY_DN1374_c0_g3_i1.p1  ORF type:complete len:331 (-),score=58.80 TRINITY_DN1374_c0_g3_i1:76-1068(-)
MRNSYGSLHGLATTRAAASDISNLKSLQKPVNLYRWVSILCCLILFMYATVTLSFGIVAMRCANPPYESIITEKVIIEQTVKNSGINLSTQRGDIQIRTNISSVMELIATTRSADEDGLDNVDIQKSVSNTKSELFLDYFFEQGEWEATTCSETDIDLFIPESLFEPSKTRLYADTDQGDIYVQTSLAYQELNALVAEAGSIKISNAKSESTNLVTYDGSISLVGVTLGAQSQIDTIGDGNVVLDGVTTSGNIFIQVVSGSLQIYDVSMGGKQLNVISKPDSVLVNRFINGILSVPQAGKIDILVYDNELPGTFALDAPSVIVKGDGYGF